MKNFALATVLAALAFKNKVNQFKKRRNGESDKYNFGKSHERYITNST